MAACTDTGAGKNESAATTAQSDAKAFDASNPFFAESTLPLHYPQFDKIKDSHFAPAFDRGMAEHLREAEAIAGNAEAPSFDNTIIALRSEEHTSELQSLMRISYAVFCLKKKKQTKATI